MHALAEENAGRAVQLRHNHAFRTVDNKRAAGGHIRNGTKIDILNNRVKIFVFWVGAIELEFSFQRNAVSQAPVETLLNGISRRIDIIIDKLENEVITSISYWKVFVKNLEQTLLFAFLRSGF